MKDYTPITTEGVRDVLRTPSVRRRLIRTIKTQAQESKVEDPAFRNWYLSAYKRLLNHCKGDFSDMRMLAAVIAILSPRTSVRHATNAGLELYRRWITYAVWDPGQLGDPPSGIISKNWEKACLILCDVEAFYKFTEGWQKTSQFYRCLIAGTQHTNDVVLDTWSLRGLGYGDPAAALIMKREDLYNLTMGLFCIAARDMSMQARQVQALQWRTVMKQNGRKTFPPLME